MVELNKWQKEVAQLSLEQEKKILKEIEQQYKEALKQVETKISELMGRTDVENLSSIIYQLDYQKALKGQISAILDDLKGKQFTSIQDYLKTTYEDGFLGTMYDLQGQGIPIVMPIDQEQMVRAIMNDTKLSKGLYESLGQDVNLLKKEIQQVVSRSISQNYSYAQISQQIQIRGDMAKNKAYRIARTEGHRIQESAKFDAQTKAKEVGADVVKQWDAALDRRTRGAHARLDGQIREIDEPFEYNGHKAMYPGDFGVAALDINCRCTLLQRARWALDEEELEALKKRAEYFEMDKAESFEDYKKKYLKALDEEVKNPYEGKQYHMLPDGTLAEGVETNKDVFEIMNKDNVELKDGKLYVKDAEQLNKVQTGEDFTQYTWSMNEDGTFKKGAIKDQAQFKLNLNNNQVLTVDLSDLLEMQFNNPEYMDNYIISRLPSDSWKQAIQEQIVSENITSGEALKKVLSSKGYKGLNIVNNNTKYQDVIDNHLIVLDDSLIKKTKKSKLETLTTSLATQQKKLNKIDNKTYTGIWKDPISVSDYKIKKTSIQAKKEWYLQQLNNLDPTDSKVVLYKKYLDDLDEFEKLGKEYEKLNDKISKIKTDINKLTPKSAIDTDAYSQKRKDEAYWFTNKNGSTKAADAVYREKSGEVWRNANKDERSAIYEYTRSYNKFNEPLRGIEYGTNKYLGVGNVDLETIGMSYGGYKRGEIKKLIDDMTNIIDKSSYDSDIWLQRGVRYSGMDKFFGVDIDTLRYSSEKELQKALIDTQPTEYGFMSTAVSKGKGFSGDIILNIYAPRGTKMMYAEPFSAFGMGDGKSWDGISKQSSFGGESEMILQRGTKFKVVKVEKSNGMIYIDLEVIGQNH